MILTVDIGNTNLKFGLFEGEKLIQSYRLSVSNLRTADEYGFYLTGLMRNNEIEPSMVKGAIYSSVNPNLNYTIGHMIEFFFGVKPLIVGAGIKTGLNIKYDNPKEVGADRIVDSVAAYYTYGGNCIVLDCGTATTFNVINESGEFLGGAISFGLKSGADSLSKAATKLPGVELTVPAKAIGKNTITNMQSGIMFGYIGMVEYIIKKLKSELGGNVKVIATGGLSEIVVQNSNVIDFMDRTLTLRGLYIIYQQNMKI